MESLFADQQIKEVEREDISNIVLHSTNRLFFMRIRNQKHQSIQLEVSGQQTIQIWHHIVWI